MLARPAAIKLIHPDMLAGKDRKSAGLAVARFHREAEAAALGNKGLSADQFRLSCQIRVTGDMKVRPAMTVAAAGMEAGPRPEA